VLVTVWVVMARSTSHVRRAAPKTHHRFPVLIAANGHPARGRDDLGLARGKGGGVRVLGAKNVVAGLCNLVAIVGLRSRARCAKAVRRGWFDKIFTAIFFAAHYSAFCAAHALLHGFFFFDPGPPQLDALLDIGARA
jgi:hypothetical protein